MKMLIKYLAVLIVALAISVTVYVSTSSNNSVQMQNKEALAINEPTIEIGKLCCELYQDELCVWPDGFYRPGDWYSNH